MQIVTYSNETAPKGFQHIAHIVNEQPGKPGKPGKPWTLGFHPVVFRAPTAIAAREQAQAWWDSELAKAEAKRANAAAAGERARNRKAA